MARSIAALCNILEFRIKYIEMKELKIGFLQQHNTADTKDNLLRLAEGISDLAKRGAELIVLQELHNSLYLSLDRKSVG